MILKNDALQELYDRLLNGPLLSSPYAESPVDRAFKECDEKLQKDIDIWKCGNEILISTNTDLASDRKRLKEEIEELKKKNADLKKACDEKSKANVALITSNTDLSDRLAKLQKHHDRIDRCWTSQIQENMELRSKITDLKREKDELASQYQKLTIENKRLHGDEFGKLKKDLEDAKNCENYFRRSRDDWRSRAKHAEDEVEQLKKDLDNFQEENDVLSSRAHCAEDKVEELKKNYETVKKDRDFYFNKYQELKKDYDKLSEENRKLNARTDCLHEEVKWYKEQSDKIQELKSRLNGIYGIPASDLWDMLQNVNDSQPNEFDVECESMHDVIGMDLEDFLIAYKKWQEQKEIDRMRNWLIGFCDGRVCEGCPLESVEFKCGCGYSFKKANQFDTRIIPDEDIKRYYEKARGDGDATFYFDNKPVKMKNDKIFVHDLGHPTAGINRGITKACEDFCKAVRDADMKITENIRRNSWECTLTANVEVDKDLLNKVCGIKPKEEEHQLEYGDAVRVPWKSYDYMYIGPEGKHIRLFDPKTHTVVVVSVRDNMTYQGCKIILCDEDDIRKIWKHE